MNICVVTAVLVMEVMLLEALLGIPWTPLQPLLPRCLLFAGMLAFRTAQPSRRGTSLSRADPSP